MVRAVRSQRTMPHPQRMTRPRTEAEVLEARKTESISILNELDQKSALLLAKVKSKELIAYIDIGNVLIDNNCCERAVRPFTNLRKSFDGFSSEIITALDFVAYSKGLKNFLGMLKTPADAGANAYS